MILTLSTILHHSEVHKIIEDDCINFNKRLLIDIFNEAQCLERFRFRKCHLIELAEALWSQMLPYLLRDSQYDRIRCTNDYRCPFETTLLIMMFRFSRPFFQLETSTNTIFAMISSVETALSLNYND